MLSCRAKGARVVAALVVMAGGCWADFPDSRFDRDGGADQPPAQDLPAPEALPDGAADLPRDATPTDAVTEGVQPDQGPCPAACSSCTDGVCQLPCAKGCTCPAGWSCEISCGANGCDGDVDCSQGTDCTVDCLNNSCSGAITCGSGTCMITCDSFSCLGAITCGAGYCSVTCNKNSCKAPISCAASCGCSVDCRSASCTGNIACPPACSGGCYPNDNCDNC
jgi:hypothetical protein